MTSRKLKELAKQGIAIVGEPAREGMKLLGTDITLSADDAAWWNRENQRARERARAERRRWRR